jgi:1,4-dihydroxy-2-naphthoate polyprenyltransferase
MSTLVRWLRVSRAPFLTASAMPVIVGTSLAWATSGRCNGEVFALALFGMMFIHAGANLANEYFDHVLGADKLNPRPSPLFGGSGSIQEGLVTAESVRLASVLSLAIGSAMGLRIAYLTGSWLVIAVGVVGIAGAWCYTAPPLKFAYRTFGELTIGLLFGILPVWTSYYIQTGVLDLVPLVPALVAAILIANVVLANEFPDATTDKTAGKRSIVVRFGARRAAIVYTAAVSLTYVLAAVEAFVGDASHFFAWLMYIATMPLALRAVLDLYSDILGGKSRFRFNVLTIVLDHVALLVLAASLLVHVDVIP